MPGLSSEAWRASSDSWSKDLATWVPPCSLDQDLPRLHLPVLSVSAINHKPDQPEVTCGVDGAERGSPLRTGWSWASQPHRCVVPAKTDGACTLTLVSCQVSDALRGGYWTISCKRQIFFFFEFVLLYPLITLLITGVCFMIGLLCFLVGTVFSWPRGGTIWLKATYK